MRGFSPCFVCLSISVTDSHQTSDFCECFPTAYLQRRYRSGVQNFSDVPGKPVAAARDIHSTAAVPGVSFHSHPHTIIDILLLEGRAGGATPVAPAPGVASACPGLSCHTLPTLTACLLSPSVAGGGAPGHASYALQPLDDKALSARPAGWHGLCSLREWRPDGEPGGGRRGERSPMRYVAP